MCCIIDDIKHFAIIKNGIIEIEGQKVHKQAGDQRNGAKAY